MLAPHISHSYAKLVQRQSDEEKQKDFKEIQIFCQALASLISKSTLGSV